VGNFLAGLKGLWKSLCKKILESRNLCGTFIMNERIKELEKQATETVKCGLNGTSTAESFNRKKFAELIVKECAEVGLDSVEDGDDLDAIMKRVHNNILTHFGVEE
jgi:hypothetical protein